MKEAITLTMSDREPLEIPKALDRLGAELGHLLDRLMVLDNRLDGAVASPRQPQPEQLSEPHLAPSTSIALSIHSATEVTVNATAAVESMLARLQV